MKRSHVSRVVKVSDRGWSCHEFEPSTTEDLSCRGANKSMRNFRGSPCSSFVTLRNVVQLDITPFPNSTNQIQQHVSVTFEYHRLSRNGPDYLPVR
ncbi:hypothetical protein TNCV_3743211 [Trichonephila clavipes]|nr:hypothetical protein TNCV_3743211 [Trichonephila clavipes]